MGIHASTVVKSFENGGFDTVLANLYGKNQITLQRARYQKLTETFLQLYGDLEVSIFSVPGRSEISGNHTDHNQGTVLACALDIDIIAIAAKTAGTTIRIKSEGYREDVVDCSINNPELVKPGTSSSLISGVCAALEQKGYTIGGFSACTTSAVLSGSGCSSSAAFEVMCGNLLSHFYNNGAIPLLDLAQAGQYAENHFFGKPSGLMDQAACAVGGFLYIDFADTEKPQLEKVTFDLDTAGYALCIINTGGSHADLTPDYAAVPNEMRAVAAALGKTVLRELNEENLIANIPALREKVGDRAILRAHHFFTENKRVSAQKDALNRGDLQAFFAGVTHSGNSSFRWLQNVYSNADVTEQGVSLALALSERFGVVCRVHGGGFAGTIQAYVPLEQVEAYKNSLEAVFGEGTCMFMRVRTYGAVKLEEGSIIEGIINQ